MSDFIDNTFDNRGNIQSVGHDDMHINGQFAAVLANPTFVRRVFLLSRGGTLWDGRVDHAHNAEAFRSSFAPKLSNKLLGNLMVSDDSQF